MPLRCTLRRARDDPGAERRLTTPNRIHAHPRRAPPSRPPRAIPRRARYRATAQRTPPHAHSSRAARRAGHGISSSRGSRRRPAPCAFSSASLRVQHCSNSRACARLGVRANTSRSRSPRLAAASASISSLRPSDSRSHPTRLRASASSTAPLAWLTLNSRSRPNSTGLPPGSTSNTSRAGSALRYSPSTTRSIARANTNSSRCAPYRSRAARSCSLSDRQSRFRYDPASSARARHTCTSPRMSRAMSAADGRATLNVSGAPAARGVARGNPSTIICSVNLSVSNARAPCGPRGAGISPPSPRRGFATRRTTARRRSRVR
ncbi:putative 4'-phosphopantetheinyl transferase domain protein [Burkholderia pseudomallei]|nr:putative 4'-phosphopantetheinyl transferase domain protein [Burkholderia pseudomallei]